MSELLIGIAHFEKLAFVSAKVQLATKVINEALD